MYTYHQLCACMFVQIFTYAYIYIYVTEDRRKTAPRLKNSLYIKHTNIDTDAYTYTNVLCIHVYIYTYIYIYVDIYVFAYITEDRRSTAKKRKNSCFRMCSRCGKSLEWLFRIFFVKKFE